MNIATRLRATAELPRGYAKPTHFNRLTPVNALVASAATPGTINLNYQGGRTVRRWQKSWSGVNACIAQMHCDCELYVDLGGDAARLSVVLEQVGGQFEIRRKNWSVHSSTVNAPRPLSLIPAGLQAHASANGVRFLRHLIVQFDMTALDLMVEDEIDLKKVFAPRFMFAEPSIMHLAQLFADECAADAPHARLYGDNLSIALVLALSRLSSPNALSTNPRACLASWQLRRLNEYVNAHLGEDLPLNALSDLVNLSRSYFSRAFKISTGLAPHQWVRQTRIAKAKQLMVETDAPIAQIAIIVGFADQAHFTRNFGDAVGESPANWRRNRLT